MEDDKRWTVWVGGLEVVEYLVDKQTADRIAERWVLAGFEDTAVSFYTDEELAQYDPT